MKQSMFGLFYDCRIKIGFLVRLCVTSFINLPAWILYTRKSKISRNFSKILIFYLNVIVFISEKNCENFFLKNGKIPIKSK